jgi:hypothetical protein
MSVSRKVPPALLVALCGVAALLPAMISGFPFGADLYNHFRHAEELYGQILSGHLDPGWFADSNIGFGDARFRFYPPAIYYLLAGSRFLFGDWYVGSLITFAAISAAGAVGVYYWCRGFCSRNIAILAGAIFAIAPFHLNELYQASLLSEYAAGAALAFGLAFTFRIFRSESQVSTRDVAGLAASYAILVLTNLPTAVIGSIALGLYACLLLLKKRSILSAGTFYAGIGLGLLASSWFWVRMLSELSWVQAGGVETRPHYLYQYNFIFSPYALTGLNSWLAGALALATLGFFVPALGLLWARKTTYDTPPEEGLLPSKHLAPLVILFAFSFFMTTDLSRPLWLIIPKLEKVQFPFRWLTVTTLAGCPLLANAIPLWVERVRKKQLRPLHLFAAVAFALSLIYVADEVILKGDYLNRPRFNQTLVDIKGAVSFKDWLPNGAAEAGALEPMKGQVSAGERSVVVTEWTPHQRTFELGPGSSTDIRLRSYYYPLWKAVELDKSTRQIKTSLATKQAPGGSLLIMLPPGSDAHSFTIRALFTEPARTTFSRALSLVGVLLIGLLGLSRRIIGPRASRRAVQIESPLSSDAQLST